VKEIWHSTNFYAPQRRSWPWPPTRLELLAARMGVDDETLRQLLQNEIERREVTRRKGRRTASLLPSRRRRLPSGARARSKRVWPGEGMTLARTRRALGLPRR
jgi:hypothetical protein